MPAKHLYRIDEDGIYSHIYNRAVEGRIIFNDEKDYQVFLDYLRDYLSPPQDPESIKKAFTVHGRIFRGTPHQPKNYFNKVELMAYSLMPDHFHLLLHQKTRGSLENFLRSLCTRYSMYFNKKYEHSGSLFEGPYKSVQVKDETSLLQLTRYLHHTGSYSSYPDYLGKRETLWVKPEAVLSFFGKGTAEYKNFVEKDQPDQQEKELIEGIALESETKHLERSEPTEFSEKINSAVNLKPLQRIPEFLAAAVVFLLLLTFGIRNITLSIAKSPTPPVPAVLSETEKIKEIKPKIVTIKIDDETSYVNIRQKPTTDSEKIGKAKNGDSFELVSLDSGWYEVKLAERSTGFILAKYVEEGEAN